MHVCMCTHAHIARGKQFIWCSTCILLLSEMYNCTQVMSADIPLKVNLRHVPAPEPHQHILEPSIISQPLLGLLPYTLHCYSSQQWHSNYLAWPPLSASSRPARPYPIFFCIYMKLFPCIYHSTVQKKIILIILQWMTQIVQAQDILQSN